jgi:PIN domain nuclease of toxin-antitoxin system
VTVFVLDSSAVLRFLDTEAGADHVENILISHAAQSAEIAISAVQWGEIAGCVRKRLGPSGQDQVMEKLSRFQPSIVAATGERAVHAAAIKIDRGLPYADAFALDLAMDSTDHVLVTADYDFKAVDDLAHIEFLPQK